jgi:hypothetical protein
MKRDLAKILKMLLLVGRKIESGDSVSSTVLDEINQYGAMNRRGPVFWQSAVGELSDEDVASIARGLTYIETKHPEFWMSGSVSGPIWLFQELLNRRASGKLIDELSSWILQNTDNPYLPFGGSATYGARNYSEYILLRERHLKAVARRKQAIERQATEEREARLSRARAGHRARNTPKRQERIEELAGLTITEQLERIAHDPEFPPQFFPTNIANSADSRVVDSLSSEVRRELLKRLKGKRRGPWGSFKKRLYNAELSAFRNMKRLGFGERHVLSKSDNSLYKHEIQEALKVRYK